MNSPDQALDQEESSQSYYSSTSFFNELAVSKFNPKKKSHQHLVVPLSDRIHKIQHQLINQVSILSPTRIRGMQFRKQLKNYRFGRVQKQRLSMFGSGEEELLKEQQTITLTFLQIMKEFKKSEKHKFYLIVKKDDCVYYFLHDEEGKQKGNSFCCARGKGKILSQLLTKEEIEHESTNKEDCGDSEEFVIKNYEISILWGFLLNFLAVNNLPFQIITNFAFMNASQDLCQEVFNGNESKKNYEYIAVPKKNLLDEEIKEVFRLKLQGLWMYENMQKLRKSLQEKYQENKFDLEMNVHKYSPNFKHYYDEEDLKN